MSSGFLHAVACVSFWIVFYHILVIHLSINGHLSSFHLSAIANNVTMNMDKQYVLETWLLIILDKHPEVELLAHKVILFLIFWGTAILFSTAAVHFTHFHPQYKKGIHLSHWASLVAQMVKSLPVMQETQVQSLGRKIPRRRKWQLTPIFLPGKLHGRRSLAGYSPWSCKESDTAEPLTLANTSDDFLFSLTTVIRMSEKW